MGPQSWLPASEVKCLHFHGTKPVKPIPDYQVFKGNLFALIDQATDYGMSKLARKVGVRGAGPENKVAYEIPKAAVSEIIINALAHRRDYQSDASVQVYVFVDRVAVWNPGELPPTLTPAKLKQAHSSVPRNKRLCEALFLAAYIDKAGTGVLDVLAKCREAGLPEPDFVQDGDQFTVTLWRDALTPARLDQLGLNERQKSAVAHFRSKPELTNAEYQSLTGVSRATAKRDLDEMIKLGILMLAGAGRSAPTTDSPINGSQMAHKWLKWLIRIAPEMTESPQSPRHPLHLRSARIVRNRQMKFSNRQIDMIRGAANPVKFKGIGARTQTANQVFNKGDSSPNNFIPDEGIERMGTGIRDMIRRCKNAGLPELEIRIDGGFFVLTIRRKKPEPGARSGAQSRLGRDQVRGPVADPVTDPVDRVILLLAAGEMSPSAMWNRLGLKHRPNFRENYLRPALERDLIEPTIPDKPTSRLQKYRLTERVVDCWNNWKRKGAIHEEQCVHRTSERTSRGPSYATSHATSRSTSRGGCFDSSDWLKWPSRKIGNPYKSGA